MSRKIKKYGWIPDQRDHLYAASQPVLVKLSEKVELRIKSLVKQGAAPEATWLYIISKFATKPPKKCYDTGLKNQALSYQRLAPILSQLKGCLAAGYPFVFSFSVYESFETEVVAKTGKVPMPDGSTGKQLCGHAILATRQTRAVIRLPPRPQAGED